jgi:hypothetical protein
MSWAFVVFMLTPSVISGHLRPVAMDGRIRPGRDGGGGVVVTAMAETDTTNR